MPGMILRTAKIATRRRMRSLSPSLSDSRKGGLCTLGFSFLAYLKKHSNENSEWGGFTATKTYNYFLLELASTEVSGVTTNAALDTTKSEWLDEIQGLRAVMTCLKEKTYIFIGLKLGEDAISSPVRCVKQGKSVGSVYLAIEQVSAKGRVSEYKINKAEKENRLRLTWVDLRKSWRSKYYFMLLQHLVLPIGSWRRTCYE